MENTLFLKGSLCKSSQALNQLLFYSTNLISLPTALRIIFSYCPLELHLNPLKSHPNRRLTHLFSLFSHTRYVSTTPHFLHFSTSVPILTLLLPKYGVFQEGLLNSTFSPSFSKIPPLKIPHPVLCSRYTGVPPHSFLKRMGSNVFIISAFSYSFSCIQLTLNKARAREGR